MINGIVYIAGAGPGDIGLITLKAFEVLKTVDVILYDNLANKELLRFCKEDAEKIFVGKQAKKHFVTQEQIIDLMIEKAKDGKSVLRLKGGDPLIFGRGSEEASALNKANVNFEIIPGISSASGASAYCGIPLTHRNLVTQCVFITAHETSDKKETQIEWHKLSQMKNSTLAIYMGAETLPKIAKKLIDLGRDPNEKIAIIQNATLPYQRTFITKLNDVDNTIQKEKIKAPIITLISPSIKFREELKWYEKKPLFGKRIVLTRAMNQSQSLNLMLSQEGANVIQLSTIKIIQSKPNENLKELFSEYFDWVIFTSENGVNYLFTLLYDNRLDARVFYNKKIATIGSQTANSLFQYGLKSDFVPENYTSVSLINAFAKNNWIKGKKFLRIKGDLHTDYIADKITDFDGFVKNLEVYKTLQEDVNLASIEEIKKEFIDAYLFTSSSTVNNFFSMLGNQEAIKILSKSISFAIGPVTAITLKDKGINNLVVADIHTAKGIVMKVKEIFSK